MQLALALAPVSSVSAAALPKFWPGWNRRERRRAGSLLFDLTPGQPPQITIEPWVMCSPAEGSLPGRRTPPSGSGAGGARVLTDLFLRGRRHRAPAGRRHALLLTLTIDDITLTVGLSGWTTQDWAAKHGSLRSCPPPPRTPTPRRPWNCSGEAAPPDDLTRALNVAPGESRALLQRLCVSGTAMYDPETGTYRHRALFPQVDLSDPTDTGREERQGVELHRSGALRVVSDEFVDGERVLTTHTQLDGRTVNTTLRRNVDGRVTSAECDCSHFQYPDAPGQCRYLVA